ncbi:HalOD1 output domain-containing protein [Natrarchaeobius sp. A-rgal3]|uniref:HalOD1 output domain-containing protein n=1 Tax=Natrarchaeobius versutus TaxID=1679078 RepID=UPI00351039C2
MRVVEQVADAEGVLPDSLEAPLNDLVDPTSSDRVFESTATAGSTRRGCIAFNCWGYDVTVSSDGTTDVS